MTHGRTNRLILLVISSTFLLPLIVVWLMLKGTFGLNSASSPQFGYPVDPPVLIAWPDQTARVLQGNWSVLLMGGDPCEATCRKNISDLHQTYQATANHPHRLQFAVWLPGHRIDFDFSEAFPEAMLLGDNGQSDKIQKEFAIQLAAELELATLQDVILILDPAGRVTMYYTAETDARFLAQDLRKISQLAHQQN